MPNVELKIRTLKKLKNNIKILSTHMSSVKNLQLDVRIPSEIC